MLSRPCSRLGAIPWVFKTTAIDFNAKNMRTLLVDGMDPFMGFTEDKSCRDIMVEVMEL